MLIKYHIEVTGGNATVTPFHEDDRKAIIDADTHLLRKGKEKVKFTSNDNSSVIRYRDTSPFNDAEVGPNTNLELGPNAKAGKGPFDVKNPEKHHHFDCGFINREDPRNPRFVKWGRTDGADTPADDGSGSGPG